MLSSQTEPALASRLAQGHVSDPNGISLAPASHVDSQPRELETFSAWDFRLAADYPLQAHLRHNSQQVWIYVEDGANVSNLAIAVLARTFEDQIQPRLRAELGREPFPGVDGREAVTILLLDVRDDLHYGRPPYQYISGYFDPVNQLTRAELGAESRRETNEREMIYLDVAPTDPESDVLAQSAAHEYAHLIAWNYDHDEERWLDEVIGQLAVHVAGLPHPVDQLRAYLATPERSLTEWTGDVADYGQAYAFGLYLYEQLGGQGSGAAARLVQDPRNGLAALGALLPEGRTAGDLLRDFGLAVRLDLPADLGPRFGFRALAIGGDAPDALPAPAAHVSTLDALPDGRERLVMPPWSVRFEHFAVSGAPIEVRFDVPAPACFGTAWFVDDMAPDALPLVGCALGGRLERVRLATPLADGTLLLVIANPSDQSLAIKRHATVLFEAQSTPSPIYLPFGLSNGVRHRIAP